MKLLYRLYDEITQFNILMQYNNQNFQKMGSTNNLKTPFSIYRVWTRKSTTSIDSKIQI